MEAFIFYSLESAICLLVLLLPYLIWFKNTTFYQWNRFYLLGAIFFSLLAPLVNIQIETAITPKVPQLTETLSFFQEMPELSNQTLPKEQLPMGTKITSRTPYKIDTLEADEQTNSWDWEYYALVIYFLGFVILGGMLFYRLSTLWQLIHQGKKIKHPIFTIVNLPDNRVFSFFRFILFNQQRYGEQELATLLKHEQVHIKQWHSLDVLMLEILQVVFWFNPLYRIYLKHLQQEHEYFVDATTSRKLGQSQYAQMLLSMAVTKPPLVGHAFAYIPVKHRIFKLFQKPSTTMEKSRFFVVLPIVLSLFFVFSCSIDELDSIQEEVSLSGTSVKNVKAFFVDEQSLLKSQHFFLEVGFDEKGAIIKKPITSQDFSLKNLNNYAVHFIDKSFAINPFEAYSNYIEGLPDAFYAKNIQNLVVRDPVFKNIELLLYHNHMDKLIDLDISSNLKKTNYNSIKIDYDGDKIKVYNLKGEGEAGKSSISMDVTYEHDLPTYWRKTREYVPFSTKQPPMVYYENMPKEKLKEQMEKQLANTPSFWSYAFKMQYNSSRQLSKLASLYLNKYGQDENISEKRGAEMRLLYNAAQQLYEMEMYNAEGRYLRKYRFHYNESGYCTRKELINQEGNVEFSVRFTYEFFD